MLKQMRACVLVLWFGSVVQHSQGRTVTTSIYPSCSGTGLSNFSYAKGVQMSDAFNVSCNAINIHFTPPPITITWFSYDTYPPAACGNADLPAGDQCCHSTNTSTLTFYDGLFVNTFLEVVATSTGNVTAGAFLGETVIWELVVPSVASLNFNCGTAYGQEARGGLVSLEFGNGILCLNGFQMAESCPGLH